MPHSQFHSRPLTKARHVPRIRLGLVEEPLQDVPLIVIGCVSGSAALQTLQNGVLQQIPFVTSRRVLLLLVVELVVNLVVATTTTTTPRGSAT